MLSPRVHIVCEDTVMYTVPTYIATTQYSTEGLKPDQIPKLYIHFNISSVTPQNSCDGKLVGKFKQHIQLYELFHFQKPV